ncbi:hypothetical protein CI109_103659 [Kwoniella shandongensis]|uniref:Uncharacterized protein n=1 Tax=Kwoniella shandongensis TaxID=1734106 RepID=A0A5M6C7H8_9TREE|nr:uncharacterized protein CI109_000648 [Kwoniella shandongensis]KAA5531076.1 hypothetical protein CI109_000648 [Kwoniella shandongensis]
MATVVASSGASGRVVRRAGPGTILIVCLVVFALYVFLRGKTRKDRGSSRRSVDDRKLESDTTRRAENKHGKNRERGGNSRRSNGGTSQSASENGGQAGSRSDSKGGKGKKDKKGKSSKGKSDKEGEGSSRSGKDRSRRSGEGRNSSNRPSGGKEPAESSTKNDTASTPAGPPYVRKPSSQVNTPSTPISTNPPTPTTAPPSAIASTAGTKPPTPPIGSDLLKVKDWTDGPALSNKLLKRDPNKRPERPSGRDPSILLKRGENGELVRGPLPGKAPVRFNDGGVEGKEASSIASYNVLDPTNKIYDMSDGELADHVSKQKRSKRKGGEGEPQMGKVDGSESPYQRFIKDNTSISAKLKAIIERAELLCSFDLLNPEVHRGVLDAALKDVWVDNVGPIPQIVHDALLQMIVDKVIDIPKVMELMGTPNPDFEPTAQEEPASRADQFVTYLGHGGWDIETLVKEMRIKDWKNKKLEDIRRVIRKWSEEKVQRGQGVSLLLVFFIPFYRATTKYQPARMMLQFTREWEGVVSNTTQTLVNWIKYIGKLFLITRMFSPVGADLSNLTLRVQMKRRTDVLGFLTEYTVFVPTAAAGNEAPELKAEREKVFRRALASAINPTTAVKHLAAQWAENLNKNIYGKENGGRDMFRGVNPFAAANFIIRPGIDLKTINKAAKHMSRSGGQTPRLPPDSILVPDAKLMPVSQESIEKKFRMYNGYVASRFAQLFRNTGSTSIRFINKHQYHWYRPPPGGIGQHPYQFDQDTFETLMMFCGRALYHDFKKRRFHSKDGRQHDDEGGEIDEIWPDIGYGQAQLIDFGGMLPFEGLQSSRPTFLSLHDYTHLKTIVLPYMQVDKAKGSNYPNSVRLLLDERWGLLRSLARINVILLARQGMEREQFKAELISGVREQMEVWRREFGAKGSGTLEVKELVRQRINEGLAVLRSQVSFMTAEGAHEPTEEGNQGKSALLMDDFIFPEDQLPDWIR